MQGYFARKMIYEKSNNQRHQDKSDEIAAGRSCQFTDSCRKSGKYRNAHHAKQHINQVTDRASFHSQHICRQINSKICKGNRNRAEWKRNRERSQNTGYRRHHANQRHPFGCKVRSVLRFCGKYFTHDMNAPFL